MGVPRRLTGVGMHVGMSAVPGHQLRGRDAAGQVLSGDLHPAVAAGTVGVDDGVDDLPQLGDGQVATNGHVTEEPDSGLLQGSLEGVADGADGVMVRCHPVADQPERDGQPVDHRHLHRYVVLLAESLGRVDARRAGADDGDHQRCAVHRALHRAQSASAVN